jgi:hypothetical protein
LPVRLSVTSCLTELPPYTARGPCRFYIARSPASADIVGYSKMGEMQVLTFVERFLGAVAALLESLPSIGIRGCATKNTWGDALYMVFSRVPDAGTVALLLSDLVQVRFVAVLVCCWRDSDACCFLASGNTYLPFSACSASRGISSASQRASALGSPCTPPRCTLSSIPSPTRRFDCVFAC